MRVEATAEHMTLDFIAANGNRVERLTIGATSPPSWQPRVPKGAQWSWQESDPGPGLERPAPRPRARRPLAVTRIGLATDLAGA